MQICVVPTDSAHSYQLHFSCEFPMMPHQIPYAKQEIPIGYPVFPLDRRSPIRRLARRMARLNRGRFCVELADPVEVYSQFLFDLVHVTGVNSVEGIDRYTLHVRVAGCFGLRATVRSVAECVARHFYPDESIDVCATEAALAHHNDGHVTASSFETKMRQFVWRP